MNAVLDNDVLHKGTSYGILSSLLKPHGGANAEIGILGAARFVIPNKIKRSALNRGTAAVLTEFQQWVSTFSQLDPTIAEQKLAAELESLAQQSGVSLDVGESQLCAIVLERRVPFLLTGDKRAIAAIESLFDRNPKLQAIGGKVKCIEQLVLTILTLAILDALRAAVCSEPQVDKTLTICFACASSGVDLDTVKDGLNSYIRAVRAVAGRVLAL